MQRAFVCHDPSSRPGIQVCGNVMTQKWIHTNPHLHKFDWLPAWDYVKKCICQVLNNIWIYLKYVWEQNYIDWAFCVKYVIIKFVARPKHWLGSKWLPSAEPTSPHSHYHPLTERTRQAAETSSPACFWVFGSPTRQPSWENDNELSVWSVPGGITLRVDFHISTDPVTYSTQSHQ